MCAPMCGQKLEINVRCSSQTLPFQYLESLLFLIKAHPGKVLLAIQLIASDLLSILPCPVEGLSLRTASAGPITLHLSPSCGSVTTALSECPNLHSVRYD